jgi:hypothetical protein
MKLHHRYHHLSFWNKWQFWAGAASFLGLLIGLLSVMNSSYWLPKEKGSEISIRPIIKVYVKPPVGNEYLLLSFKNEGALAAENVRIRMVMRLLTIDNKVITTLRSSKDWHSIQALQPNTGVEYALSLGDVERCFQQDARYAKGTTWAAMSLVTSATRSIDKERFMSSRILFFIRDASSNAPILFDAQEHGDPILRKAEKVITLLDEGYAF